MRPLLDDIDEVRSEVVSEDLHTEPGTSASPSTPGQTSAERRPFSFFRSYRFPPRPAVGATDSAATAAGAGNESATPTSPQSAEEPQTSVPTEDVVMDGEENAPADAHPLSTPLSTPAPQHASSGDARTASPPSPGRQMVPMLLVGVRSASLLGLPGADSNTTGPSPDTPRPGQSFDEPMSEASASNSFGSPVDNASGNHTRPSGERESGSSGFVLWILGGLYPANHPIVIAPSLLGDDSTSYEELLRLAEVLGNVKPPTVSKEEIKKSDLKVVKSQTIAELYANGSVREITSERCLGELRSFLEVL